MPYKGYRGIQGKKRGAKPSSDPFSEEIQGRKGGEEGGGERRAVRASQWGMRGIGTGGRDGVGRTRWRIVPHGRD